MARSPITWYLKGPCDLRAQGQHVVLVLECRNKFPIGRNSQKQMSKHEPGYNRRVRICDTPLKFRALSNPSSLHLVSLLITAGTNKAAFLRYRQTDRVGKLPHMSIKGEILSSLLKLPELIMCFLSSTAVSI
jgi:hypothetical protein